jgi:hypothetical protein
MAQTAEALQEASAKPRLVFFTSRLSGRCRLVDGYIAQVLQLRHNHDTSVRLDVNAEERPDLFERFKVKEYPPCS